MSSIICGVCDMHVLARLMYDVGSMTTRELAEKLQRAESREELKLCWAIAVGKSDIGTVSEKAAWLELAAAAQEKLT